MIIPTVLLQLVVFLGGSHMLALAECEHLSADAGCGECNGWGHCTPGSVPVDPWLDFALKTQREIQIDEPFANFQMFDSHNAFNNRGDGFGGNDSCTWPPPYDRPCQSFANHEFSLIDQLNMGIRGLELDPWWCHDAMRLAHMATNGKFICFERNKLWSSALQDIGNWLAEDGNEGEFVRIYINEKVYQGHDDEFNEPIWESFGSKLLTPQYLEEEYGGEWPTMRKLRKDGKNVAVMIKSSSDSEKDHGGLYVVRYPWVDAGMGRDGKNVAVLIGSGAAPEKDHGGHYVVRYNWVDAGMGRFTSYPTCGGKDQDDTRTWRFHGDATHYPIVYDGPSGGIMLDFVEMVKCHVQWPASDMVHPQMMRTAVFTWAEGEPAHTLQSGTCISLRPDNRWYVEVNCYQWLRHACQSHGNEDVWTVSETTGPYSLTSDLCPPGYKFSLPNNGYRQMKVSAGLYDSCDGQDVITPSSHRGNDEDYQRPHGQGSQVFEAAHGESVWINYTPFLPGYVGPSGEPQVTTPSGVEFLRCNITTLFAPIMMWLVSRRNA